MTNSKFKKVFFDPGYLPIEEVESLMQGFSCLKLIRHREKDLMVYQERGLDILLYPDHTQEKLARILENDIEKTWSAVINDHQTSVLFDRTTKSRSEVFKFNELLLMCCCYQNWLEQEKPDFLIYTVTPHNIKTWVLSKVAEKIGIPVIYFQESFFPWRQFMLRGLCRNPKIIIPATQDNSKKDYEIYKEYIRKKTGSLEEAMPSYELNRLKKNDWKLISLKTELKNFLKKPISSTEKIKSYLTYKNLSRDVTGLKYVVLFLHYQPERSTIPEGYGFGIQLAAILALQQALPKDAYLVVREHPSTYTYNFSKNYRSKDFYKTIGSIERVIIAPITDDPYKIIDNSIATASITGTVTGEALARGKACISFGSGLLQAIDSPNFHRYTSIDSLRAFLENTEKPEENAAEKYYDSVRRTTITGIKESHLNYDEKLRREYLNASIATGVKQLLTAETNINS